MKRTIILIKPSLRYSRSKVLRVFWDTLYIIKWHQDTSFQSSSNLNLWSYGQSKSEKGPSNKTNKNNENWFFKYNLHYCIKNKCFYFWCIKKIGCVCISIIIKTKILMIFSICSRFCYDLLQLSKQLIQAWEKFQKSCGPLCRVHYWLW